MSKGSALIRVRVSDPAGIDPDIYIDVNVDKDGIATEVIWTTWTDFEECLSEYPFRVNEDKVFRQAEKIWYETRFS